MKIHITLGLGRAHLVRWSCADAGVKILVVERLEFWSEKSDRDAVTDVTAVVDALSNGIASEQLEWWRAGSDLAQTLDENLSCVLVEVTADACLLTAFGQVSGVVEGEDGAVAFQGDFRTEMGVDLLRSALGSSEVRPVTLETQAPFRVEVDFRSRIERAKPSTTLSLEVSHSSSFHVDLVRESRWGS